MNEDFEQTRKFWSEEILRGNLVWPDEQVIRFVKKNFKIPAVLLDFGCGAGRNAVALAHEGFEIVAMDYTEEAVRAVGQRAASENLKIKAIKNEGLDIPFDSQSVDGIIADGSLFYNNKKDNIIILENLGKVLKPAGKIWADWRTERDSLIEKGVRLENGLYKLGDGSGRNGCCYFFCNEQEVREIYNRAGLKVESVELFEITENNMTARHSWYHVVAVK